MWFASGGSLPSAVNSCGRQKAEIYDLVRCWPLRLSIMILHKFLRDFRDGIADAMLIANAEGVAKILDVLLQATTLFRFQSRRTSHDCEERSDVVLNLHWH